MAVLMDPPCPPLSPASSSSSSSSSASSLDVRVILTELNPSESTVSQPVELEESTQDQAHIGSGLLQVNPDPHDASSQCRCPVCGQQFQSAPQLYGHWRKHAQASDLVLECCTQTFKQLKLYLAHIQDRHASHLPEPINCPHCPWNTDRAFKLRDHLQRIHEKKKDHPCQYCSQAFFKASDLKTHVQLHLGFKRFTCEVCQKQFAHGSNFKRHRLTHTQIRPLVCAICGSRFRQHAGLRAHFWNIHHHPRSGFACPLCPVVVVTLDSLKRHGRAQHEMSPEQLASMVAQAKAQEGRRKSLDDPMEATRKFHCYVCGQTFPRQVLLQDHVAQDHSSDFKCQKCGKSEDSQEALLSHTCTSRKSTRVRPKPRSSKSRPMAPLTVKPSPADPVPPSKPVEEFNAMSEVQYMVIHTLSEEMAVSLVDLADVPSSLNERPSDNRLDVAPSRLVNDPHNIESSELEPPEVDSSDFRQLPACPAQSDTKNKVTSVSSDTSQKSKFCCPDCAKVFSRKDSLKQHLSSHHPLNGINCRVCDQVFAWRSTLHRHLWNAHGLLPSRSQLKQSSLKCAQCTLKFRTEAQLQIHVRRDHVKERQHHCTQCSKTFFKKSDLKTHLRVHTNDRPYACDQCSKSFSHISAYHRHRKKLHAT
ncbi:hypothetical protein TCAL_15595 [Tigriopus californicus]|uniref:C2H2-type domain-containing protein n=1 Tax=Tigriopus californicus TaxID=6832 RepID=A0A553PBK5_TIGCA|nr:zinc finger protein 497-like [Tigriopus californicus]TRY75029.1 hypothetical protein TCAL_15595 [Tigriopus californicus]